MAARRMKRLLALSILVAFLNLGLKVVAYYVTGSAGLLADAGESVSNLVAALVALFALLYAARPVDETHTYGHEKIEYFSSGMEGMLIFFAAAGIAWYAVRRLMEPQMPHSLDIGIGLSVVATLLNLGVGWLLVRTGRQADSIVLEADGRHLLSDAYTTIGVLVALTLVWLTQEAWLDPVIALVVVVYISWLAFDLVRRSFDGLMDRALPAEEQARVRAAIESALTPGMDYHALRTRRAGSRRFVDFHLLVPGVFTVRRAHEITERIEQAIRAALPTIEVTVHIEPIEERSAWEDSALLALEQAARQARNEG
jgi:cation diffusion facilitator family transporter